MTGNDYGKEGKGYLSFSDSIPNGGFGKALGAMLGGDAPQPSSDLEHRLDAYVRIADRVTRLVRDDNPLGALYLIEQLGEQERNGALYGIVAGGIAQYIAMMNENPEEMKSYEDTGIYELARRALEYCTAKMDNIGALKPQAPKVEKQNAKDKKPKPDASLIGKSKPSMP